MNLEKLRCFIPVGGYASRLRPLTHDVSKPCVRFLNKPLIEFSMVTLAEQGVRNFVFGERGYTNYTNLFDQYGDGVGFSAKYEIEPRVHIKHQPNLDDLGSADSYRLNMKYYEFHDPFLVVQGDNLFDIDLKDFIKKHEEKGALMTIALTRVEKVEEYGIVELSNDLRIKRFIEKPQVEKAPSNFVNAGIYLLSPEVKEIVESEEVENMMKERGRLDFGFDIIPYLVDKGYPVYGYELKIWYDVGSPERYLKAMHDVLYGKLDVRVSEEKIFPERNIWVQGYSEESIKRRKDIIRKYKGGKLAIEGAALIGRHTRIGDYSKISDSSIDNFCILGENVNVEGSAIMDAAKIGDYVHISDSILGRKVVVESSQENSTKIESTSVIGNSVYIREGCRLIRTKVNPNLRIPRGATYIDKFLQNYEDVVKLAT
ncbi:MAG: NDP-sugar synthase [Candidatus Methylarchaceae archaeon HK02M1]|nr:NDP-sugar synthase [Candidatus Methylarchaceae archaeon HK02M1]